MPGNDAMGWIPTVILGIVGSFVGGFVLSVLLHDRTADSSDFRPTGLVGSVIGALLVLGIWHLARRRRAIS
ncbi:MAG TPA: GlsB/YeaQ/YmgE family stress response membrane protein [Gemmatimonadales bacterium]